MKTPKRKLHKQLSIEAVMHNRATNCQIKMKNIANEMRHEVSKISGIIFRDIPTDIIADAKYKQLRIASMELFAELKDFNRFVKLYYNARNLREKQEAKQQSKAN